VCGWPGAPPQLDSLFDARRSDGALARRSPSASPLRGAGSPAETATTWLREAWRGADLDRSPSPSGRPGSARTGPGTSSATPSGRSSRRSTGSTFANSPGSGSVRARDFPHAHVPAFPDHDDYGGWVRLRADPIRSQRAFWHLVLSGPDALDSVQAGLDSPNADVRRWSTKAMDHLVDANGLANLVRMLDDPIRAFGSRLATPLLLIDARTTDAGLTRPPCSHGPSRSCSTIPTHMFAPTPSSSWGAGCTRTPRRKRPSSAPAITTRRRRFGRRPAGTRLAARSTARHHQPARSGPPRRADPEFAWRGRRGDRPSPHPQRWITRITGVRRQCRWDDLCAPLAFARSPSGQYERSRQQARAAESGRRARRQLERRSGSSATRKGRDAARVHSVRPDYGAHLGVVDDEPDAGPRQCGSARVPSFSSNGWRLDGSSGRLDRDKIEPCQTSVRSHRRARSPSG
jgi:hypothetical protein